MRQFLIGVIFPGAGFIELAFEAAIMASKVQQLVISNIKFKMPLILSENLIQNISCTKQASNVGKNEKFEIKQLTDQGEHILSTAEITMFNRVHSNDALSFSEACKYT